MGCKDKKKLRVSAAAGRIYNGVAMMMRVTNQTAMRIMRTPKADFTAPKIEDGPS